MQTVPLRCTCGVMRGTATGILPSAQNRSVCYCDDCQVFAHYLERAGDVLDAHGGTEAFPLTPAQITISEGAAQLRSVRLGPKGLYRWYAGCCRTPVANTLRAGLPMAIVVRSFVDLDEAGCERAFGPIRARIMASFAIGRPPADAHPKVPPTFVLRVLTRIAGGWFSGAAQPSPFFDPAGQPRGFVFMLDKAQRIALRQRIPAPTA
jgi:hypothetical protein